MNTLKSHIVPRLSVMTAAAVVVAAGFAPTATRADDTEALFIPPNVVFGDAPNILFVLDTSLSMGTVVGTPEEPPAPVAAYSAATDYTALATAAGCERNRIYWSLTLAASSLTDGGVTDW